MSTFIENRTGYGSTVLMYADDLCAMFGAHGVKIDNSGELQVLIVAPDESGWVDIGEATVVQAGATRAKTKRN